MPFLVYTPPSVQRHAAASQLTHAVRRRVDHAGGARSPAPALPAAWRSAGGSAAAGAPPPGSARYPPASTSHSTARLNHRVEAVRPPPPRAGASRLRCSAAPEGEDRFYESEVVQQESASIMGEYESMNKLLPKFAGFDLDGKYIFLDKMDDLCARLRIFNYRAKLSNDPSVKQFLSTIARQLLYMNTNLDAIYDGMMAQSQHLRELTDAEAAIADPAQLAAFRAGLAREMSAGAAAQDALARNLNMDKMMDKPWILEAIMSNPKALMAIRDVTEDPKAVEKYRDNPQLYNALKSIFELP